MLEDTIHQIYSTYKEKEKRFSDMIELNTKFENDMNVLKVRDATFS